jgi:hypothetical protein
MPVNSREQRQSPEHGVIFSSDVYQGAPAELRGKARFLRIFSIDNKTYTFWYKRLYISTGPVVSAVQSEGVKRLLGTVPIEPDGSVAFKAPAGLTMHFQLLDEWQRALHTMRSFVSVMPGEYREWGMRKSGRFPTRYSKASIGWRFGPGLPARPGLRDPAPSTTDLRHDNLVVPGAIQIRARLINQREGTDLCVRSPSAWAITRA